MKISCDTCSKTFKNRSAYLSHRSVSHKNGVKAGEYIDGKKGLGFSCKICGTGGFESKCGATMHIGRTHPKVLFADENDELSSGLSEDE